MNKHKRIPVLLLSLLAVTGLVSAHDEHAPHFDAPQHGGVVLEFHDEIHYEVVVASGGQQLQVWLGDAHRRPLAASEVTDLVAEVGHADKHVEPVDMHISNDGNYWTGAVHLKDPNDIVRHSRFARQAQMKQVNVTVMTTNDPYVEIGFVADDRPGRRKLIPLHLTSPLRCP